MNRQQIWMCTWFASQSECVRELQASSNVYVKRQSPWMCPWVADQPECVREPPVILNLYVVLFARSQIKRQLDHLFNNLNLLSGTKKKLH